MSDIRRKQEQTIWNAVKAESDEETANVIVYGEDGERKSEDDATWVKGTMDRLERHFDTRVVKQIRMNCQCGRGMAEKLSLLQDLMASSSTVEAFASQRKAKESGLFSLDGELYLRFPFCTCPMLEDVDRLKTDTWCECTAGYSKVLFEKAFGCTVDVILLKSVKMGDDECLMKIIPSKPVW